MGRPLRSLLLAAVALGLAACGPSPQDIARAIREARPDLVRAVEHDAVDDFYTIIVDDAAAIDEAVDLSCETIQPTLDEAGSTALFAVYSEDDRLLTSWNRCLLLEPTPH